MEIDYWERVARDYERVGQILETHTNKYLRLAEMILKEPAQHVVDLGCGSGMLLHFLRKRGFRGMYTGLDFSSSMLKIAKRRFAQDSFATFIEQDISKPLPVANNSIDVCTCINVLFNLKIPLENVFQECSRILRDRGLLVIVEPNAHVGIRALFKGNSRMLFTGKKIIQILGALPSIIRLMLAQALLDSRIGEHSEHYLDVFLLQNALSSSGFRPDPIEYLQANTNYLVRAKKI